MLDSFFRIFTPAMFGYLIGNLHVRYQLKQHIEKNREVKAKAGLDKLNNKVNRNPSLTFDEFKALVQKGLI